MSKLLNKSTDYLKNKKNLLKLFIISAGFIFTLLFFNLPTMWPFVWILIVYLPNLNILTTTLIFALAFICDMFFPAQFGINIIPISFALLSNNLILYLFSDKNYTFSTIKILTGITIFILSTLLVSFSLGYQVFKPLNLALNMLFAYIVSWAIIRVWKI